VADDHFFSSPGSAAARQVLTTRDETGPRTSCQSEVFRLKRTRLMARASPINCKTRMPHQLKSISYQRKPCRAEVGCAGWVLCQPSQNVSRATHQLLRESSQVSKRALPHKSCAELTREVDMAPSARTRETKRRTHQ